jgi:hypothetical protein
MIEHSILMTAIGLCALVMAISTLAGKIAEAVDAHSNNLTLILTYHASHFMF